MCFSLICALDIFSSALADFGDDVNEIIKETPIKNPIQIPIKYFMFCFLSLEKSSLSLYSIRLGII